MRGFGGILALAVLGACGHHAAPPPPVEPLVPGATAPIAAAAGFPEKPPFVGPGERMTYRLSTHDLDVATYTLAIGEVTQLDGVDVVVVQAGVETSPLVSMVKNVADNFTSWIDVETSRPVLFRSTELADDESEVESTDATPGRIVDGSYAVTVTRSGEVDRVERQVVGDLPMFDFNGFLIELRSWAPAPGTSASADVLRSRFVWRTTVTMAGYEEVVTELGQLPAVRIDGQSQRVGRDGQLDPKSDIRHYQLWISDDADRVPLQIVARTDYGDLRMDIIDYQPGADRLAP
jgi:hypothetical protein